MANNFPGSPSGYHVRQLSYRVQCPAAPQAFPPDPDLRQDWITFSFDTGTDGSGNPTWDYGSFDQDATETDITTAVTDVLTATGHGGALYCLARVWVMEADTAGPGTYDGAGGSAVTPFAPVLSWMEIIRGTPSFPS